MSKITDYSDDFTITLGGSGAYSITDTMSSGITWTTGTSPTVTLSDSIDWNSINSNVGKSLQVEGDAEINGDLKVNGKSIMQSLEAIEERLAILNPNPELEDRWQELRDLRNKYEQLEKEIIEKEKMWSMLKK